MAGERNANEWADRAVALLESRLRDLVAKGDGVAQDVAAAAASLDSATVSRLIKVLRAKKSYREGILIQFAYGLTSTEVFDMTQRQVGGRNVAKRFGLLLQSLHISATKDAFQIIGKNQTNLVRGNVKAFDELLAWSNSASRTQIEAVFDYVAASLALEARPIDPMPDLDRAALTFAKLAGFVNALLATPSGGAYEQFALAAFVEALLGEYADPGPGRLRVETKNINASDASSSTAADIQLKRRGRTEEAFEVTANDWSTKPVQGLVDTMRAHDLPRMHLVASVAGGAADDFSGIPDDADISLLDIRALLHGLLAFMHKPARAEALKRLYELLDRKSDVERTNAYVALLHAHGLTG